MKLSFAAAILATVTLATAARVRVERQAVSVNRESGLCELGICSV